MMHAVHDSLCVCWLCSGGRERGGGGGERERG